MEKVTDMSRFIDPNGNDSLSSLNGENLQDLLCEMGSFYLTYRDKLYLPSYVTFGTEIEYEKFPRTITTLYTKLVLPSWLSDRDGSIFYGGELISPCMKDEKEYWVQLKKACCFLEFCNAQTMNSAGGHVHVGAHVLGDNIKVWKNFLKLYACYEHILYRFSLGDKVTPRPKRPYYAKPIADALLKDMSNIKDQDETIGHFLSHLTDFTSRYSGVNFENIKYDVVNRRDKNTLEFRFPNATLEEVIWQNNINAFAKMMLSARNGYLDEDFLNYRVNHKTISSKRDKYLYNEMDLVGVLEFVDLVFDKNIDKVYFLRQYLRDYHNSFSAKGVVKAKRFIK